MFLGNGNLENPQKNANAVVEWVLISANMVCTYADNVLEKQLLN